MLYKFLLVKFPIRLLFLFSLVFSLYLGNFTAPAYALSIFDEYNINTYEEFFSLMQRHGRTDTREINEMFFAALKARGYEDWNRLMDILQISDQVERSKQLDEWRREWKTKYNEGIGSLRTINPIRIYDIIRHGKESPGRQLYQLLLTSRPDYTKLRYDQRFLTGDHARDYVGRKLAFYQSKGWKRKERNSQKARSAKWQERLSSLAKQEWHHLPIYPEVYQRLGIDFLHRMALTGSGVTVGVFDLGQPFGAYSTSYNVHDLLPPEIFIEGSDIPYGHGISTIGVIARRQEMVDEPPALAPSAKIFLREPGEVVEALIYQVRYHPILVGRGIVAREEERMSYETFTEKFNTLRPQVPKSKPFIITHTDVTRYYDQNLAYIIEKLIRYNIKLVYASMDFAIGRKSYQALQQFKKKGGIVIVAAGNQPYAVTGDEWNLIHRDVEVHLPFYRLLIDDPELAEVFLLAGSLKDAHTMSDFSTQAGELAGRYLVAFGDDSLLLAQDKAFLYKGRQREQRGTSFAAPMIAGGIALLMEAFPERLYPQCTPQFLAQVLLNTAAPIEETETVTLDGREQRVSIPHDPWVSGQGAMDLKAAFEWLSFYVGPPVLPGRRLDLQGEASEDEDTSSDEEGYVTADEDPSLGEDAEYVTADEGER